MNRNFLDSLYGKLLSADNTIERLEAQENGPADDAGKWAAVRNAKIQAVSVQREIISETIDLYLQTH